MAPSTPTFLLTVSTLSLFCASLNVVAAVSCSAYGYTGSCVATSDCTSASGGSVPNLCPGGADIQCCLHIPCSAAGGSGTCKSTSVSRQCSGTYHANACPGDANFKCCVASTGGGGSTTADKVVSFASSAAEGKPLSGWAGGPIPYSWGGGHRSTPGPSLGTCSGYSGSIHPCPADTTVGVDCSGFSRWMYALAYGSDVLGSGNAESQARKMTRVSTPQPGDLVFFGADFHHVGVVISNGKMINAPKTGTNVRIDNIGGGVQGYYRL